jgi:hypothetical protein
VIDWNSKATSSKLFDADDSQKKHKGKSASNWLSVFLGVEGKATKQDAASLTKLSVTLGKDRTQDEG